MQNQIFFILKVFFVSALLSFFIKNGLDKFFVPDDQFVVGLAIVMLPALSLFIILLIRQTRGVGSRE